MNDPNLSHRELNPHQQIKREKKDAQDEELSQKFRDLKKEEEDQLKIGNLDKFKMVKSNSGAAVLSIVLFLYAFVLVQVIVNFAVFLPMYNDFSAGLVGQ